MAGKRHGQSRAYPKSRYTKPVPKERSGPEYQKTTYGAPLRALYQSQFFKAAKAGKESKMTIIDLIEKLKKEVYKQMDAGKEINGSYGVLEQWYIEMLTLNPRRDQNRFDSDYYNINGLIWGLRAAYYITQEEMDQLKEDLDWIDKRFYGIND